MVEDCGGMSTGGIGTGTPAPVRTVTDAAAAAMSAAAAKDPAAWDAARVQLAGADPALVRELLGGAARTALERSHPQGLDSADARDLLERCVRSALGWLPDVEVPALVLVLTGALGMQSPDEEEAVAPDVIGVHALLLMTELGADAAQVQRDLAAAIAELQRAQTVEMP